jgi:hypothetical protein
MIFYMAFYETLTRIPRFVNGDEWYKSSIKLRNHGGDSHEFGVMPHLVGGDSRIQVIPLLISKFCEKRFRNFSKFEFKR